MTAHTTEAFRRAFARLPQDVQKQARGAYRTFQKDPYHSSLWFKQVHPGRPIYSVRVSLGYRALGVREDDKLVWFWIGSHAEYDKLVAKQ